MSSKTYDSNTKKIKELLLYRDMKKETRMIDMAREIEESPRMTYFVISGHRFSPRIRNKIADYLKVPLEDIFPSKNRSKAA